MGDPVPAGDGQLKVGPEGSHLPQRIIEVGDIHEEADEEPGGEMTDGNKVNAISQDDELPHAGQESEHGNIYVVGDAGFYRGRIVDIVGDRKSTRLNSSHTVISYAVFCLKKKKKQFILSDYILINTYVITYKTVEINSA